MLHTVELIPGGRRFEVQQGESILQGGLRAGANLRYNCSNGTCGECRAKVLQGSVNQIQYHDFCFSAAETAQGCILMCSNTALGDLRLAATELGAVADIPEQQLTAKISKTEFPSDDHAIVHLRTPRSQTLQFLAGQEVHVRFAEELTCRLPLANCPCNGLRPQFHLRRVHGDPLSEQLFGALRNGTACEMRGPTGDFVLREETEKPLLFIAYETGFAPVYSLLEHVIALDWQAPLQLIWLADDERGLYLKNYCRSLQDALDDFTFSVAELGDAQNFAPGLRESLERQTDLSRYDVYAVPPPEQVAATRTALLGLGILAEHLKIAALETI
ncbi:MAG: 2Fe-2S iron-sulfur cluster-binding protein [Gammaproteobacteria bacterium]|nr:2Fe-2S iron-sulfur cluster-binding protein [Gammaproteobacteria bacterium]